MIPFPGESVGIDGAKDLGTGVDASLYNDILRRSGSRTLSAGGEWRVWVYPGETSYLQDDPGADVEVSWVVEVTSGSATLTASWGFDPTYFDETASTPISLGTHSVDGPATLVMPTSLTADDVLNHPDAFTLRLDCAAGDVSVQQVKLRVWPTTGVPGGWVSQPAWTEPTFAPAAYGSAAPAPRVVLDATASTVPAADSALGGAMAVGPTAVTDSDVPLTTTTGTTLVAYGGLRTQYVNPTTYNAHAEAGFGFIAFWLDPDPGAGIGSNAINGDVLTDGVDYITPPEEVGDDWEVWAQVDGDAYASTDTTSRTIEVSLFCTDGLSPDSPPAGATVTVQTDSPPDGTGTSRTKEITFPIGGAVVAPNSANLTTTTAAVTIPALTTGQGVYVIVGFSGLTAAGKPYMGDWIPSAVDDVFANYEMRFDAASLDATLHHPPYRVWSPSIVPVRKLRQYHRDDGLGIAPRRAYGGASRNHTGRAYGYT